MPCPVQELTPGMTLRLVQEAAFRLMARPASRAHGLPGGAAWGLPDCWAGLLGLRQAAGVSVCGGENYTVFGSIQIQGVAGVLLLWLAWSCGVCA